MTIEELKNHAKYAKENNVIVAAYLLSKEAQWIVSEISHFCGLIECKLAYDIKYPLVRGMDYAISFTFGCNKLGEQIGDDEYSRVRF